MYVCIFNLIIGNAIFILLHMRWALILEQGEPRFYGKEVRTIRGHYFRLRRSVDKPSIVRKWRHSEQRSVQCKRMNALIVVGDLEGIRRAKRGRSFNRCISSQPFYMFKQTLTYKANWDGIRVLTVSEAYISQTCSSCGVRGQRVAGRFSCQDCELVCDADVNCAWNIGKRAHGMLRHDAEAVLTPPGTLAVCEP